MISSNKREALKSQKKSFYSVEELDYSAVLKTICFGVGPKTITEIGIGTGYSLQCFIDSSPRETVIKAYDLFENFEGNHPLLNETKEKFPNISVENGDFFELYNLIEDNSLDILHVDVANDGKVYQFVLDHYIKKMTNRGVVVLEGGSETRDQIGWMKKYKKTPIAPVLERNRNVYGIETFGEDPSITLIKR